MEPAVRGSGSGLPDNGAPDPWVELAVGEGRRALDQQREELNAMRTRAVAFSALTVSASAFLVGSGLDGAERTVAFYVFAVIGTLAFASVAVLLVLMVAPRVKFRFILSPDSLMDWSEGASKAPSRAIAMRALAKTFMPEMIRDNEGSLGKIRTLYRTLLTIGTGTIGVWVLIVWIFT